MSTTTRAGSPVRWPTATRASSWIASSVWPCRPINRPMSSSSGSGPITSTYIVPSSSAGSTVAVMPIRSSMPSRNSVAISACSSRSSWLRSPSGLTRERTTTMACWEPTPNTPDRGSWTTWTSASCSLRPSSPRAASMASSTLGALLRISSTAVASGPWSLRVGPRLVGIGPGRAAGPSLGRGWFGVPGLLAARLRGRAASDLSLLLGALHHRGHGPLLLGLLRLRLRVLGQLLGRRPALEHEVLLTDLPPVRRRPVQDETGREEDAEDAEQHRHHLEERLLLGRGAGRAGLLHLSLLVERGPEHQHREHVVGDPIDDVAPAVDGVRQVLPRGTLGSERRIGVTSVDGRAEQIHAQEGGARGRPREVEGLDLRLRGDRLAVGIAGGQRLGDLLRHGRVQAAVGGDVDRMLRPPQHRVHRDQDRELQQHRPAPRERVDPVVLVELHDLFLLTLLVPLVLALDLLDLRLHDLHVLHRPDLLDPEREQDQPDHDGEQDDGHPVVRDELVDLGDHPAESAEQRLPRGERDHRPGSACMTASYLVGRLGVGT